MEATARAHTNIALVKYWGKRNEQLILPMNGSVSMTLDNFYTTTTVTFEEHKTSDVLVLNGKLASEGERKKVELFLDEVRKISKTNLHAQVESINHVPTAAGLASSASGFAALAAAATRAIGLELDDISLSRLARKGSGSACRSIYGGFVEWQKGSSEDGCDSYGVPLFPQDYWDLRILATVLVSEPKSVSSRDGMQRTVETSPYYSGWLATVEQDLIEAKNAIRMQDLQSLGSVAEANALKMHATTLAAKPPFTYWQNATLSVIRKVQEIRAEGTQAYFTIDAGPNVKVLCTAADASRIRDELRTVSGVKDVIICGPGPGVVYLQEVTA